MHKTEILEFKKTIHSVFTQTHLMEHNFLNMNETLEQYEIGGVAYFNSNMPVYLPYVFMVSRVEL